MFWSQKTFAVQRPDLGLISRKVLFFSGGDLFTIWASQKIRPFLVGPKHVSDTSGQDDMYVCICVFI